MNRTESEWLTLEELKKKLNKIVKDSGYEFKKKLQEAWPGQSENTNKMWFMPVKVTFSETFAGLGDYCYVVNIKYNPDSNESRGYTVYRAELTQHRRMKITRFPKEMNEKDLGWLGLTDLTGLLNNIAEGSGDSLELRLEQALPDDLASSINNMEFMLIYASSSGPNSYFYEIRIKDKTSKNPDLGIELTEFSFKLWQGSRI